MHNMSSISTLYDEESSILSFMELKPDEVAGNVEHWKNVVKSHIEKQMYMENTLMVKSLGKDLHWVNTDKPLSLDVELKNKIIVLDFFTYCCINCEHALPLIQQVEEEFQHIPEFSVIGVHSPKFPNEKATNSVKNAALRNNIKHPIVNDCDNYLWNMLGVYCWPTVLILSPLHNVLFSLVGEAQIEKLSFLCHEVINFFNGNFFEINKNPIKPLAEDSSTEKTLYYPAGISSCSSSIIVSDTGHNRLLLISVEGEVLDVVGNGSIGLKDGYYADSQFNRPHGTAWWKSAFIFVADTGNHCIRLIDLIGKKVVTIFSGTNFDAESKENTCQKFASPWDVCLGPQLGSDLSELNVLYIAVAGSHQIWAIQLEMNLLLSGKYSSLKCTQFAGSGKEECRNNLYKLKAGFAQPSGISYSELCPGFLFVADSENSTVRILSLKDGSVKTAVGGTLNPEDLFAFGDCDGEGYNVRLQHPLGVCAVDSGKIYITDTYNHKIKVLDEGNRKCTTVAGSGIEGSKTNAALTQCQFDEPSGICCFQNKDILLIADTNNHCIKVLDLEKETLATMQIFFTNSCCVDSSLNMHNRVLPAVEKLICHDTFSSENGVCTSKLKVKQGGVIKCSFKLSKTGLSVTDGAPQPWNLSTKGDCNLHISYAGAPLFNSSMQPSLAFKCENCVPHECQISLSVDLTVCDNVNQLCFCKSVVVELDVQICENGYEEYNVVFDFE